MTLDRPQWTRRHVLQTSAAGVLLGLAGCNSSSDERPSGSSSTTESPIQDTDIPPTTTSTQQTDFIPENGWPMPAYDSTNSFHNPHVTVGSKPSISWQTNLDDYGGDLFFGSGRLYINHGQKISVVDVKAERALSGRIPLRVLTSWGDVLYYSSLKEADDQGTAAIQADDLFTVSTESGQIDEEKTPTATPEDGTNVLWEDDRIFLIGKRSGSAFYGLTDNEEFVALDAIDGNQQWSSETPIQVQDFLVTDTHVVLYNNEQISALDIKSGEEQWRKVPDPEQVLDSVELDESIEDLIDDPTDISITFGSVRVSNGTLLVFESNGRYGIRVVSGRDLTTGDPIWFQQNAGLVGITEDQFFSAFGTWDVGTGDSRWHVGSEPPFATSQPLPVIATQDQILIAGGHPDDSEQGRLVAFHQSDGSQSWSLDLDARIWRFIAVRDTIYATTTAGTLLAIS